MYTGFCSSDNVKLPPWPRATVKSGASSPSGRVRVVVVVAGTVVDVVEDSEVVVDVGAGAVVAGTVVTATGVVVELVVAAGSADGAVPVHAATVMAATTSNPIPFTNKTTGTAQRQFPT